MSCCNFLKLFVPVMVGSVFAGWCGTVEPGQQTVAEGTTVQFRFTEVTQSFRIEWHYANDTLNRVILLCDSKTKHCKKSNKYTLLDSGHLLSIKTVTHSDSGDYFCFCYNKGNREWSSHGKLNVKRAKTSSSNERELHQKTISTENTKEYNTMTNSATAKVESKTVKVKVIATTSASNEQEVPRKNISSKTTNEYRCITNSATANEESETLKTEVIDSAMEQKVSSTLEDTSQVITIAFAGGVAVGVMLTIIVVVIIHKKRKKDDIHRGSQKSGPTQTLEGTDSQENSLLPNYSNRLKRRYLRQEVPAVQHTQKNNPDDQQASGSTTEQTESKYETIIPVTDRAANTREREMYQCCTKVSRDSPEDLCLKYNVAGELMRYYTSTI